MCPGRWRIHSEHGTGPNRTAAKSTDLVLVNLNFREQVLQETLKLSIDGSSFQPTKTFPPPNRPGLSSTFIFAIEPAEQLGESGTYGFFVEASDIAGNTMKRKAIGSITVDNSTPTLSNVSVTPNRIGGLNRNITVNFNVDEEIQSRDAILSLRLERRTA